MTRILFRILPCVFLACGTGCSGRLYPAYETARLSGDTLCAAGLSLGLDCVGGSEVSVFFPTGSGARIAELDGVTSSAVRRAGMTDRDSILYASPFFVCCIRADEAVPEGCTVYDFARPGPDGLPVAYSADYVRAAGLTAGAYPVYEKVVRDRHRRRIAVGHYVPWKGRIIGLYYILQSVTPRNADSSPRVYSTNYDVTDISNWLFTGRHMETFIRCTWNNFGRIVLAD